MQITINLSSTPYLDVEPLIRRLRAIAIGLGALTTCAAILLGFAHFRKHAAQTEENRLDTAIARESDELTASRKLLEMPENVSIANRALALNSLFDEKSFSWTLLMKQFEGLVPPEVQLATIQPVRGKDGAIDIRMHVIGPREKVIELIHGIELSKNFSLPHVTAETAHNNDARPNQRALALTASSVEDFDIEAGYDEDASPAPQPVSDAAVNRDTASAVSTAASKRTATAQLAAAAVPASSLQPGGTR
jgi:type IV pilus assembly protein PilN